MCLLQFKASSGGVTYGISIWWTWLVFQLVILYHVNIALTQMKWCGYFYGGFYFIDGGRSMWEKAWQTCKARVTGQTPDPVNNDAPTSSQSGITSWHRMLAYHLTLGL